MPSNDSVLTPTSSNSWTCLCIGIFREVEAGQENMVSTKTENSSSPESEKNDLAFCDSEDKQEFTEKNKEQSKDINFNATSSELIGDSSTDTNVTETLRSAVQFL